MCLPWKSNLEWYPVRADLRLFTEPGAGLGWVLGKGSSPRE